MRNLLFWSLAILWAAATPTWAAEPAITTDEQKTFYALGLAISQSLNNFTLSEAELTLVQAGLSDGVLKRAPKVDMQAMMPQVQELQKTRMAVLAETEKKTGEAFLAKAAASPGATKTESGLIMTTLTPGSGASPSAEDTVTVHYHGTLVDGTVFDSSVQKGQPATFKLNGVIKCWTEGVQRMKMGEKSRLVCPAQIAYGDRGAPPRIRPGATLVFEVELLDIAKKTP